MSWRAYVCDTMTGLIAFPIDLPAFSWSLTVSDSSMRTTSGKGTGEGEASSLKVPWSAVPGADAAARASALASLRRSVCLMWQTEEDAATALPGTPVVFGAIGQRVDTQLDTTFSLVSPLSLLAQRYLVREGRFGTAPLGGSQASGGSSDAVSYGGMSLRGIASEVGYLCTSAKPGGLLPIDWTYRGERGGNGRTFRAYDVQNLSCASILEGISNVDGGPDMQLRPYLDADGRHVRLSFLAASDGDVYLGRSTVRRLASFPGGGTLGNVSVAHAAPVSRVYATGAGTEEKQLCHLAEDLTLQRLHDPWPLCETSQSDSDADSLSLLSSRARSALAGTSRPAIQLSGQVAANDPDAPSPGSMWPGETVEVALDGFPSLPDGVYRMRLMEMSGDEGDVVKVKFDTYPDPVY